MFLLYFLFIIAALALAWGWYSSSLVMKMTRLPVIITPANFNLDSEKISFKTSDGITLSGWFVPSHNGNTDSTIIVCHGWGSNKGDVLDKTVFLNSHGGYNLFYFDFRSHGESKGETATLAAYERLDVEAAVNWLAENKSSQTKWLAIIGFSMGAASAIVATSADQRLRALVADSSYTTFNSVITRFARLFYGLPEYPFMPITLFALRLRFGLDANKFSPAFHIARISPRPVFIIQGEQDQRVPRTEGETLFNLAGHPKEIWYVPEAHHAQAWCTLPQEYEKRVLAFFEKAKKAGK